MATILNKISKHLLKTVFCFAITIVVHSNGFAQNINAPNRLGPLGTEVNTSTGNLFVSRSDLYVPARGLDLDISFYYNTFNYNLNRGFGNGWTFNFGMSYSVDSTGAVTIVQGDGREDIFSLSGGIYAEELGKFDLLTQYQTGKYLYQTKYGIKYYFDNSANKRLTRVEDPNGNYVTLGYQDTMITSLTNAAGQTMTLTYNGGKLATLVDALTSPTRTFSYTYDGYGNLIQVLDPLSNKTTYQYLVNGPMSQTTDKNGNTADIIYNPDYTVSELISCNGRKSFSYDTTANKTVVTEYLNNSSNQVTTYQYQSYVSGSIVKKWLTHITGNCCGYNMVFTYDNAGNITTRTDANGNTYSYTYDAASNLLTITDPNGNKSSYTYSSPYNRVTSYTDANGNVYAINYDNAGNPTQFIEPGNIQFNATYSAKGDLLTGTDGNNNTYQFAYDSYGYPTKLTRPLSANYNYTYDARGNLKSTTDPNGNSASLQYDVLSRPTKLTDPLGHTVNVTYDANGNVSSFTDQNGHTSTYGYDATNRLVTATDAAGQNRQYVYDAMNNLIQFKNPLGKTTSFTYDNLNRLTTITDALGNGYSFGYDYNGNVTSVSLPTGATANYVYDKLNRPISGSDNIGSLGNITYDANGNMISYTNGSGAVVSFAYDGLDRLSKITDPLGNSKLFTYDNNDNRKTIVDRNGHTTAYTYDALSRPTSYTDNNGNTTSVTYDKSSNILTAVDPNNNTTTYTYDALNRATATTYADGTASHYTYDNAYNLLSKQTTGGQTINYQYDAVNRLTTKTLPNSNTFTYTYDANARITSATNAFGTVTLTYDDIDRLASETFNAHTTRYSYNIPGRTKTIVYPDSTSVTWGFDTRKRLSTITKGITKLATYQYNNANQFQQLTYGNGVITNWQYDQSNRLTNISTQTNLPNISFAYDNERNKIASARSNFPQYNEQFSYDAGNRLKTYTQGSTPNNYNYDANGNRTTATINGTANTYANNNLNQLTVQNNGAQTINYTYDGNGNLTFDGNFYKRYDAENKLLVDSNTSNKITYSYDALGRRVQKNINGTATNYYFSQLAQLEQRNANDSLLNETVYSAALTPVLVGVNHSNYYYHQNDLNSVEAITNANGGLVERYQYGAYGKTSIYDSLGNALAASSIGNRFAFTGQEYDAQTSNYHFYYRNYSPTTGKFNQRDPIGYSDDMNMYQYVHNNPGNYIDLLGLAPCPPSEGVVDISKSDAATHVGNFISLLSSIKKLEESKKFTGTNILVQINNLDVAITKYLDPNNGLSQKDMNILGGEIESNATYLASDLTPATPLTEGPKLAIGALSKIDAATQEITGYLSGGTTGLSLSAIYAHQSDAAEANGTNSANEINASFDRREQRINDYIKEHGPDITTWEPRMKLLYKLQQNFKKYRTTNTTHTQVVVVSQNDCPPNGPTNGTQNPKPPGPLNPGKPFHTNGVRSDDPNQITGPTGVGTPQFVNATDLMPYTIDFENGLAASAPAKIVRVNYPLDAKQDKTTFMLGSFGFNNLTFNVPANTSAYYQRLDARDSLGLYVDVTAGIDVNNNQAFWLFQSIDPTTLLPSADPTKGFLKLQDTSNLTAGHGFVNFSIKPNTGDKTGDTTHAIASIVFDSNDTIPTNYARNTIDAVAPTSHMNGLPSNSASTKVPLSWTATDDAKGSGVKSYSLYVATNNGTFNLYATNISRKDTTFTGASGNSYSFFVLGTDSVGNTETLKPGAEATTYINAIALPVTWLYFNAISQGKDGLLTWATATETNSKSFDIERSTDGRNFTKIGSTDAAGNSTVQTNYTYTDVNVVALNIPVVYYRLKQIDKDGKATYSNIVAVQLPVINVGPIVQAYPNPFKQTLNILIANMAALDLSDNIGIYTLEGKKVYEKQIGQRLLNTTITLTDLPTLTPGMYILKLGLNKQTYSFKLMKQ